MANTIAYNTEVMEERGTNQFFGDLYIDLRQEEKRVMTDDELMFLPDIDPAHVHFKEWQMRKRSSECLIRYLTAKNKPLNILEIGCGNGWLSSKLSTIKNSIVTGLDINEPEIMQANRVLKKNNLQFVLGDFAPAMFPGKFDVILFAASIQYFSSLKRILQDALSSLKDDGEIHIIDTNFYRQEDVTGAARRTEDYYTAMGYPEMTAYYFHHTLNDFRSFNYKVQFNPHTLLNKITKKDPFYWLIVKH
ncbi:MAG: class I SAM-dependent methyltransferase [Bacteroidota bacterium]|nr:class I SAM-dependent methyltransferase [Bacteroidota bacterium]